MELHVRRRARRQVADEFVEGQGCGHDVQVYGRPPLGLCSLQQVEAAALERVRALRVLETVTVRGKPDEWRTAATAGLKAAGLKDYWRSVRSPGAANTPDECAARLKDRLGHFALRLAYCRTEPLRRWLVSRELELFRLRFAALSTEGVAAFLADAGLRLRPIPDSEKQPLLEKLVASTPGSLRTKVETSPFYKVHFVDVPDLVRNRRVYVEAGFAYVPADELVSIIAARFRADLNRSLAAAARRLPKIEADERISPLVRGLHNSYAEAEYESESRFPIDDVDLVAGKSFAPCMRRLHENLRSSHHLKHGGRLQYGLFLKAAGVTLEDAMKFWREEFTKAMDSDKFDKMYAYNVRYNYGKEGSKKNYSAYSCMKIIQSQVGPADNHGCPFKHDDLPALKNRLQAYGVSPLDIETISNYAKKGHYQIACSKYFDVTHGVDMEINLNHPNQYYEESRNVLSGKIKINPAPERLDSSMIISTDNTVCETNEWDDDFDTSMIESDLL